MPKLLLFACLLPLSMLAQPEDWETFKSFEGRFKVQVPGEMTTSIDSVETPVGPLAYTTLYYQPPKDDKQAENLMYMVSFCDYPEGALHQDSAALLEEFFETTMEAGAFSIDGALQYQTERNLGEAKGRFWRIDYLDGNAVLKTWALVSGNRFYSLQTATVKTKTLNASNDRFFDSFKIIPPEAGP